MLFGPCPIEAAEGAILVHALNAGQERFKKGRRLSAGDISKMSAAGISEVIVARLETDDVGEDEAAGRLAVAIAGPGVQIGAAFTGRANLYANKSGLALIDRTRADSLNAIDEAVTLATLPPFSLVAPRQMLATIKIIPFAVPSRTVVMAERATGGGPIVRVAPFIPRRAWLISTTLPHTKSSVLDKSRHELDRRLEAIGSKIVGERRGLHETATLAEEIGNAVRTGADPILIFGASAITDRRDVVPAAIERAGGAIERFGMPVDPGNLLLLGRIGQTVVIGLPSCARSPKLNGVDFVLWHVAAGVTVDSAAIAAMGVGGLLTEIPTRPQPRDEPPTELPQMPHIAAIVLAAGRSSRMGSNKLLADLGGKPLVRRAAETALASAADPVVVVTGNGSSAVETALADLPVRITNNPDFADGLSTSLKRGLNALPDNCDGAVVMLADMPGVTAELVDKLIAAFNPGEGRAICVATWGGKRGNPVLWSRRFFDEMMSIQGDVGARHLIGQYEELVCEVEATDDGPLIDLDTPEALAEYQAR